MVVRLINITIKLSRKGKKVRVFARVSPQHKVRIVKAIQSNDEIVAMTGMV